MTATLLNQPSFAEPESSRPERSELEAATVAHKLELLREVRQELDRELKDGYARLAQARRAAAELDGPLVPAPSQAVVSPMESGISLPFIAGFATGGLAVLLIHLALG